MSYRAGCLKLLVIVIALLCSQVSANKLEANFIHQKVVQIAVTDIPYSLSPYATIRPFDAQYSHLFFDPLVRWGKDRKLEYRLLDKLESLKNGKTRFSLKKYIYFHSGNQLTAEDVVWSFNTAFNNRYLHRQFQHRVKFTRVNDFQFDIQTKLTQAQLLDYLSHLFILDSVYYKKNKIKHNVVRTALAAPITQLPLSGTGPYKVASFYPEVNLHVQANQRYWGALPEINSLNFVKVKSEDSRLYALLADDIDISEAIPSKSRESVQLLENKEVFQVSQQNGTFLIINERKNKLFERESTRNAIHFAINQNGMLRHVLYGAGSIGARVQIVPGYSKPPVYDAKRAKYLFQKVEMDEQLSLLVMEDVYAQTEEVIVALTNMLKKVGIELVVTQVNSTTQWNKSQLQYDLMLAGWRSPLINADNLHQDIFTNSHLSKYLEYLFQQQGKALTMEEKVALFQQYQSSDRIVPLFSKHKIWAADKRLDLHDVFSVNGTAYWHQLTQRD